MRLGEFQRKGILLVMILIMLSITIGCSKYNKSGAPPNPDVLQGNVNNANPNLAAPMAAPLGNSSKECSSQSGIICNGIEYLDSSSKCSAGTGDAAKPGQWTAKACLPDESCSGSHWVQSKDSERCCASECVKRVEVEVAFKDLQGGKSTVEQHTDKTPASNAQELSSESHTYSVWLSYLAGADMPAAIAEKAGSLIGTGTWQTAKWVYDFTGLGADDKVAPFSFIVLNNEDKNLEIAEYTPELKAYVDNGKCSDDNTTIRMLKTEVSCPTGQANSIFTPTATSLSYQVEGKARKIVCCEVVKANVKTAGDCLFVGGLVTDTQCASKVSSLTSAADKAQYCCMDKVSCPESYSRVTGDTTGKPATPGFSCGSDGKASLYVFDNAVKDSDYCTSPCESGCDPTGGRCNTGFCCIRWKDDNGNNNIDDDAETGSLVKSPIASGIDLASCQVDDPATYNRAAIYNGNCSDFKPEDLNKQQPTSKFVDCAAISSQQDCIKQMGYCAPGYNFFGVFYAGCGACPVNCNDAYSWPGMTDYRVPKSYCYCGNTQATKCQDIKGEQDCANSGQRCVPMYYNSKYAGCASCPVTCKTSQYVQDWITKINPCNCVEEPGEATPPASEQQAGEPAGGSGTPSAPATPTQ